MQEAGPGSRPASSFLFHRPRPAAA